jgi:hypothetical protein
VTADIAVASLTKWQRICYLLGRKSDGRRCNSRANATDYSEEDLDRVAAELNDRPRKRLAFEKPIEAIEKLLLQ